MVTVECRKCGCRQQAAADAVIGGIVCRKCRAALRLDDGSAVSVYDIGGKNGALTCPACGRSIPEDISRRGMLLSCRACGQIFLAASLPEFTALKSSWQNAEIVAYLDREWHLLEPPDQETSPGFSGRMLSALRIRSRQDIGDKIYPLLQAIIHLGEKQLDRIYLNFKLLMPEVRLALCGRLAATPLLSEYFYGHELTEERVAPCVKAFLADDRLYDRLGQPCDERHFKVVGTYIREFVMQVFGIGVSGEMQDHLTLVAMAHGLEKPIGEGGYFIYLPESHLVRPTTDLNFFGRREFYLKDDEVNRQLREICSRWGIRKKSRRRKIALVLLIMFGSLVLLLLALLGLAFLE